MWIPLVRRRLSVQRMKVSTRMGSIDVSYPFMPKPASKANEFCSLECDHLLRNRSRNLHYRGRRVHRWRVRVRDTVHIELGRISHKHT